MIAADRRLAAAAACLAGARATALLARGPSPEARDEAARLAGLPREARLGALAAALEGAPPAALEARAAELARPERPRLAALLLALARGEAPAPGVRPSLVRVVVERLSGSAGPRTPVRPAAARLRRARRNPPE